MEHWICMDGQPIYGAQKAKPYADSQKTILYQQINPSKKDKYKDVTVAKKPLILVPILDFS